MEDTGSLVGFHTRAREGSRRQIQNHFLWGFFEVAAIDQLAGYEFVHCFDVDEEYGIVKVILALVTPFPSFDWVQYSIIVDRMRRTRAERKKSIANCEIWIKIAKSNKTARFEPELYEE